MHKRLISPLLASLMTVSLAGCGDDKGGAGSESETDPTGTPQTTTGQEPTTTTGEEPTTTTGDEPTTTTTTTTTTDPMTTTTSEMTSTTGDPVDCAAPADDADEDGDGVPNSTDNCRCGANPNQLDFDGNAVGNVCDEPLVFTIADGVPPEFNKLDTTARAEMTLSCMFPVSLIVLNGDVQVTLDDSGTGKIFAARLNFADTPELTCDLALLKVKLRIQDFFAVGPEPFAVSFPFTLAHHADGTIAGQTDTPQSILVSGIINITESSNEDLAPKGQSPLEMVPGAFPAGIASVIDNGKQVSMEFDDEDSTVFMQKTMSGINVRLAGLKGTLRLKR